MKGGGFTQNVITMEISIITTEDLSLFKKDLLSEIRELMQQQDSPPVKKYLRSSEVIKLLKISPGTLHNLRENGTLPYSKLGGLIFYEADKIARILEEGKVSN
ncbi:Helix-turn-helix domain-containing protein [Salegentibacter agarivorans]|uniref:Helix-turn-helix domain-containing protein n=1 Tax=Salegentibacter agarivorans TaxID=345907 RepID=A0A1I2KQY8_9FLAO|nr:Helix-turn-helix domain-containing protein [Salegentibacter agarivorans]